jgi:hypothetical protein
MDGSKVDVRFTPGYWRFARAKGSPLSGQIYTYEVTGNHAVNASPPSGDPSSMSSVKANSQALGKFVRRIADVNMAFNGGVFLGELRQTLQTIRNPAKGLRNLVDDWGTAARRIRSSHIYPLAFRKTKVAEALADSWLEVQYGWRPLLNDIDDGCKALAEFNGGRSNSTQRVTAHGNSEGNATTTSSGHTSGLAVWNTNTVSFDRCIVVFRGAMRMEARDPQAMDPALFGFSIENFVPTAWELIPYSFLIDYFSNIGDIINGWSHLGTRLAWCNRTEIKELYVESTSQADLTTAKANDNTVVSVSGSPAKSIFAKRRILRAEYTGTLVPDFQLEVPGSGSLKWLNIAALIASRNGDRKWSYGN